MGFLTNYQPKDTSLVSDPRDLLPRFHALPDDGHAVKVARALLIAHDQTKKYPGRDWARFRTDDEWLKAHYVLLDSTEGAADKWVRSAGFDEAWKNVPKA